MGKIKEEDASSNGSTSENANNANNKAYIDELDRLDRLDECDRDAADPGKDSRSISGTFDVELSLLDAYTHGVDGMHLNRMGVEKQFNGPLNAVSHGELLSAVTTSFGNAGYVAMEQVRGELEGKFGSFILQHYGIKENGASRLILEVVPDSGASELSGIRGTMVIDIDDEESEKDNHYEFTYSL